MNKTVLHRYAHLIAKSGVNVQKGQDVVIRCGLDQPEFVAMLTEECYKLGARKVTVNWELQKLEKTHVKYRSMKTLSELDPMEEARLKYYADRLPCQIFLDSEDPDGLKGIDQKKLSRAGQKKYPLRKPYLDSMENKYQWCVAAVPGEAWAKKLFPHLSRRQAEEKLWQAILDVSRVDDDPVAAWEAHASAIREKCAKLNGLRIAQLHYYSPEGTDLTVGMIPRARFCGGSGKTLGGIEYEANIPTEECFITPMRGKAEGTVVATMPLSCRGQLIENFRIRFENGKAVEWHAEKNEKLLSEIITLDEGSAYLGECALVPEDSPVRKSGLLFYNTLFDENASCHLALGMGYSDTLENFEELSLEQCREMGVNDSMTHVDFMIGSSTLDIDAVTEDGRTVPVFRGGEWAL